MGPWLRLRPPQPGHHYNHTDQMLLLPPTHPPTSMPLPTSPPNGSTWDVPCQETHAPHTSHKCMQFFSVWLKHFTCPPTPRLVGTSRVDQAHQVPQRLLRHVGRDLLRLPLAHRRAQRRLFRRLGTNKTMEGEVEGPCDRPPKKP